MDAGRQELRRRKGHDRYDEMWEGVLHIVPPPSEWHQRFGTKLVTIIEPIAERLGLIASYETGLFRPGARETSYRTPDIMVTRPEQRTKAGAEAAEVVFEILSPGDESREKLPFYEDLGVKEVFLLDPDTRAVELYLLRGAKLLPGVPAEGGVFTSAILGISFRTLAGPKLLVRGENREATI
ncbi:MAG TPA: Uma2 family endonuclease [Planctomycetota bacterium]|nr:Uma2 family endonuclease [Planctomycetota bacterium]